MTDRSEEFFALQQRFCALWESFVSQWITDDPNPQYSRLDRMDGLGGDD